MAEITPTPGKPFGSQQSITEMNILWLTAGLREVRWTSANADPELRLHRAA